MFSKITIYCLVTKYNEKSILIALRKEPVNPSVPMKPLYWTRIIALSEINSVPTTDPISSKKPLWLVSVDIFNSQCINIYMYFIFMNKIDKKLKQEIEETKLENINEFADLFSRQVITRKPTKKKVDDKPSKIQAAKILDGKRFQNVGILAQSLHVEFQEIEHAIYNLDTTVVNLEALHQIYEAVCVFFYTFKIYKYISVLYYISIFKH